MFKKFLNLFRKLFKKEKGIRINSVKDRETKKPEIESNETEGLSVPEWYEIALREVGTKEIEGPEHNPRIIEYHDSCNKHYKTDEIAWCSAFTNWCFKMANEKNRTFKANAQSWKYWGISTNKPKIGDIVVFGKPGSWKGHVGFFVEETKKRVLVLGGNQNNEVCKQWYLKKSKNLVLLGYRTIRTESEMDEF